MRRWMMLGALALGVAACGYLDNDWTVDGPYRLIAPDSPKEMSICYKLDNGNCIGRIPETVIAAGYDHQYVVAKVRSASGQIQFYYLMRGPDGPFVDPSEIVRGPFDEDAFEQERLRLNLPELKSIG